MFAIPPDAVRVWRGFRASSIALADFLDQLNTVSMPATVEQQIDVGLNVYIPTLLAGLSGKPEEVPDETAILFWDSQQTYRDSFNTLAARTYALAHDATYMPTISRADFPLFFTGTLAADQPYYLVPRPADWMQGWVRHLIGSRPADLTPAQFRAQLGAVLTSIQAHAELAGALACVGDDYLLYWELLGDTAKLGRYDRGAGADHRLELWHNGALEWCRAGTVWCQARRADRQWRQPEYSIPAPLGTLV